MSRRWQSRFVGMALALLALLASACQDSRSGASDDIPAPDSVPQLIHQADGSEALQLPEHLPGLTFAAVKSIDQPGVLETSGKISFDDRKVAAIISRVSGRVEDVWVSQWDYVRRGEPIVSLYSPDYMTGESEYLQALAASKMNFGDGPEQAGIGASMVAAARRKLELLGLTAGEISALRAPSAVTVLRAPLGGDVVEKKVVRGSQVNPGDVLFTVGTLDHVWITADIYQDDLARVAPGQQLLADTPGLPGVVFKGVVARVSPDIDPNTHTAELRCEVANPGARLKPEMMVRVRIITRPGSSLVVPQAALVFEIDAYYAYVRVAPGLVVRRKVTIGAWSSEGDVRVLDGLRAGEQVVQDESIQVNALWHEAHGESS